MSHEIRIVNAEQSVQVYQIFKRRRFRRHPFFYICATAHNSPEDSDHCVNGEVQPGGEHFLCTEMVAA